MIRVLLQGAGRPALPALVRPVICGLQWVAAQAWQAVTLRRRWRLVAAARAAEPVSGLARLRGKAAGEI